MKKACLITAVAVTVLLHSTASQADEIRDQRLTGGYVEGEGGALPKPDGNQVPGLEQVRD